MEATPPTDLNLAQDMSRDAQKLLGDLTEYEQELKRIQKDAADRDRMEKDIRVKYAKVKAAYDKLNDYAEQKRLSGDQKDILFYLLQIELFDNNPQPASRKELCSFLEAGNTRLMSSINALLGLGLLQEHGKRPIRYSLSETAHRQFLQ